MLVICKILAHWVRQMSTHFITHIFKFSFADITTNLIRKVLKYCENLHLVVAWDSNFVWKLTFYPWQKHCQLLFSLKWQFHLVHFFKKYLPHNKSEQPQFIFPSFLQIRMMFHANNKFSSQPTLACFLIFTNIWYGQPLLFPPSWWVGGGISFWF